MTEVILACVIQPEVHSAMAVIKDAKGRTFKVWRQSPQLRAATQQEWVQWLAATKVVAKEADAAADESQNPTGQADHAAEPEPADHAAEPEPADHAAEPDPADHAAEPEPADHASHASAPHCETCGTPLHKPGIRPLFQSTRCAACSGQPDSPLPHINYVTWDGRQVPEVRIESSVAQTRYAQVIANTAATKTAGWLWDLVLDEAVRCGAITALTTPKFWLAHKKHGPYHVMADILIRCLQYHARGATYIPKRLLAIMLYVAQGPAFAKSPVLKTLLENHPIPKDDGVVAFLNQRALPIRVWGQAAAEGLAAIDPKATMEDWHGNMPFTPPPSVPLCMHIPVDEITEAQPLIILTTEQTWYTVVAAQWVPKKGENGEKGFYTLTMLDGTKQTIAPSQIARCFFPIAER